jgi:hypothetical protein
MTVLSAQAATADRSGRECAGELRIEAWPESGWSEGEENALRAFVAMHPNGLIYYTPQYRDFLLAVLGPSCRCLYRIARRGDVISGILPLLGCQSALGLVLNSLPFFGSNGGVLAADDESETTLREDYERLARAPGTAAATWISHPFRPQVVPDHDYEDERIAQWTELPETGDRDAVLALVDSSARRNFAKAERLGVTVRETADALPFLEEVHRTNMAVIGGLAKPRSFFEELPRTMTFGRDWTLYVASLANRPVAALLLFMAGRTVEYVMPATIESEREAQPTAALIAIAMMDMARRGYRIWNWGGTWLTQDNVYRFKRKWGASEGRYRYYIALNDRSLLRRTPTELRAACPNFFVVPFGLLESSR